MRLFEALGVRARSYREAFARHPATVAVFATTALAGAGRTTAVYERAVSAFLDAGWPAHDALTAMVALEDLILGAALDAGAPADMFDPEHPADAPALVQVIEAARGATGAAGDATGRSAEGDATEHSPAADLAFEAGLAAMLAGMRQRLESFAARG